jgi:hypothetical protein
VEFKVSRRSLVSECQVTHPPSVIVGQVVTERTASLLFSGELDNEHYDDMLPLKEKLTGYLWMKFISIDNLYQKHFP